MVPPAGRPASPAHPIFGHQPAIAEQSQFMSTGPRLIACAAATHQVISAYSRRQLFANAAIATARVAA